MIGNSNYVRKNHPGIVAWCEKNVDTLSEAYRKFHPKAEHEHTLFRVVLEYHRSANDYAAHGIMFFRLSNGKVVWRPMSFYGGFAYLTEGELMKLTNGQPITGSDTPCDLK